MLGARRLQYILNGLNDHIRAEEVNLMVRVSDDRLPAVCRKASEVRLPLSLPGTAVDASRKHDERQVFQRLRLGRVDAVKRRQRCVLGAHCRDDRVWGGGSNRLEQPALEPEMDTLQVLRQLQVRGLQPGFGDT